MWNALHISFFMLNASNHVNQYTAAHTSTVMQAGDHVTVTSGAYSGRRGTVVKVKSKVCFVFDEVAQEEFEVFARDLSSTAAKVTANADRYPYSRCRASSLLYMHSNTLSVVQFCSDATHSSVTAVDDFPPPCLNLSLVQLCSILSSLWAAHHHL